MKTYEEMADSALKRIAGKEKEKKKNAKIVILPICFCLAAALAVFMRQSELFDKPAAFSVDISAEGGKSETEMHGANEATAGEISSVNENTTVSVDTDNGESGTQAASGAFTSADETTAQNGLDTEEKTTAEQRTDTEGEEGDKSPDDGKTSDSALRRWADGLTVSSRLYEAFEKDPGGTFSVTAAYRPQTAQITDFEYEGKSLSRWAVESEDARFRLQKMYELLKQGDELKYGAALYETGTPDGIKWDKRLYEDRIAYFGNLIDKYIANGVFLREQLQRDISEYDVEQAAEKYKSAYNAYLETVLPAQIAKLTANGFSCKRSDHSVSVITLSVTAEQLAGLPLDDILNWSFDLADSSLKADDEVMICIPS